MMLLMKDVILKYVGIIYDQIEKDMPVKRLNNRKYFAKKKIIRNDRQLYKDSLIRL